MRKIKALVLFSGGLDSLLAAKLLLEQNIVVTGLNFKSCFFGPKNARAAVKQLGIPLKVIDFSTEHLAMVKQPPYGYGRAANPCLDCHLLMLKKAREMMIKKDVSAKGRPASGWDFVATGEVLGERPFSQNKKALAIIAEKSGLKDRLLRPLSARVLPISLPEKKGWIDRDKLLAIQGRSRRHQLVLAKKYRLQFPQPAGGCLLTEKEFGQKLLDLFQKWPDCDGNDVALLRLGRHFWKGKTKIVLGRNKEENDQLAKLTQKKDILVVPQNFPGPTALIRSHQKIKPATVKKAKKLIISFSSRAPEKPQFLV